MGVATLAMVLVPPPSAALRVRRFLSLTLRDLRRLAAGRILLTIDDWEARVYSRLTALPPSAEPLQLAWLVAALSVGTEIIQLRRIARRLELRPDIDAAFMALAQGDSTGATQRLAHIDRLLAAMPGAAVGAALALRARGRILSITEALTQHPAYFRSPVAR
jgi:hypothetical protein